jgi:autotransporter adhesin
MAGSISELSSGLSNLSGDVDKLRGESRRGIAAVAAIGAVGASGGAPGEMGIDIGVAGFRGQGAVATNISYVTPSGVVISAGASYAGGGAAVVRLGIGFKIKLGAPAVAAPVATISDAKQNAVTPREGVVTGQATPK